MVWYVSSCSSILCPKCPSSAADQLADWAEVATSNCTYAPLSDNMYLSTKINTGMALTVRIMLPLGKLPLGL
jgi:hypothetical protein